MPWLHWGSGFFPQPTTDGGIEIYSANGELHITLNDGVKYIMRFGNIAGLARSEETEGQQGEPDVLETGVNRYLLVTTEVDESKFPIPEMKTIPGSIEELKSMLGALNDGDTEPESSSDEHFRGRVD